MKVVRSQHTFETKQIRFVATAAMFIALSSCEMKKDLDEMHDATVKMSDTTTKMEKSTSDMRDLTTDLRDSTNKVQTQTAEVGATSARLEVTTVEMYDAMKQGDSLTIRRNGFQAIQTAKDPSKKISEAAKYYMSFEFQLWSSTGQDTHIRREELLASAAKEFLRDVQEFIEPGQSKSEPFATDEKNINLNAMAAAMHFINPKQTENIHRNRGYNEVSMYSIIKDGLAAGAQIAAGKKTLRDYPAHVREVLVHERVAKLLMQARYNYFGAMALGKTTKLREWPMLKFLQMRNMTWWLDLSKLGATEIDETGRYIEGGLKVFDFLRSNGIKPEMNKSLRLMYKNMRLSEQTSKDVRAALYVKQNPRDPNAAKVSARAKASKDLSLLMVQYLMSSENVNLKLPPNARNIDTPPTTRREAKGEGKTEVKGPSSTSIQAK